VIDKRNLHAVLDQVPALWSPQVVGEVNDYEVKAANVAGDYPEHIHEDTDEIFLVLAGRLNLDLPTARSPDIFTVPRSSGGCASSVNGWPLCWGDSVIASVVWSVVAPCMCRPTGISTVREAATTSTARRRRRARPGLPATRT